MASFMDDIHAQLGKSKLRLYHADTVDDKELWVYCEDDEIAKNITRFALKSNYAYNDISTRTVDKNASTKARAALRDKPRGYIDTSRIRFRHIDRNEIGQYPFVPFQTREEKLQTILTDS